MKKQKCCVCFGVFIKFFFNTVYFKTLEMILIVSQNVKSLLRRLKYK